MGRNCKDQFLLNFYIEENSFHRTKYQSFRKLNNKKILACLLCTTLKGCFVHVMKKPWHAFVKCIWLKALLKWWFVFLTFISASQSLFKVDLIWKFYMKSFSNDLIREITVHTSFMSIRIGISWLLFFMITASAKAIKMLLMVNNIKLFVND